MKRETFEASCSRPWGSDGAGERHETTAAAVIYSRMPSASAVDRLVDLALSGGSAFGWAAADVAAAAAAGPRNRSSSPSGLSSTAVMPTDILPTSVVVKSTGSMPLGSGAGGLICCILPAGAPGDTAAATAAATCYDADVCTVKKYERIKSYEIFLYST